MKCRQHRPTGGSDILLRFLSVNVFLSKRFRGSQTVVLAAMSGLLVAQISGIPGGPEVLVILMIIVLLFGTEKIPKLAGAIGEAQAEFEKSRQEVEKELEQERKENGSSTRTTDTSDTDTQSKHPESQTWTGEQNPSENEEANTRTDGEGIN